LNGDTAKDVHVAWLAEKVATTLRAAVICTVHVCPDDVAQPLQLENEAPEEGCAVSTTEVPDEKLAEQEAPQLIPVGLLVTVPLPVPDLETVSA
jgi:hypothetical protein